VRTPYSLLVVAVLLGGLPLKAAASNHATFCQASERTFFNCVLQVSGKVASLCGSADAARPWLQYRVGHPGKVPELVVPADVNDPEMRNTFFYDVPSGTLDNSYWQVGIWFRQADAYYELLSAQDHPYQKGHGDRSAVYVWFGETVHGAPHDLACRKASSSESLMQAGKIVEQMAPKWHQWSASPWDWGASLRKLEATGRAEADAAPRTSPEDLQQ